MRTPIQTGAILLIASAAAHGQILISDDFNVTAAGTGFALDAGVNTGINPPTTRLIGTLAPGMRYMLSEGITKSPSYFSISGNKLSIPGGDNTSGRFTFSADGTSPFNFGSSLGTSAATPANPAKYDIKVSMANTLSGTARFSLGLATVESSAGEWDFGFQLYRANTTSTAYLVQKRIDTASSGLADQNAQIANLGNGTYGSEVNFLIRVTDAGAETTTFNSRIQISIDDGATWIYDTSADSSLTSGFRFDGADRFISFDQAGSGATITGGVTYDNFSITAVPEPSALAFGLLAGLALFARKR